jgi:hypothetical protein
MIKSRRMRWAENVARMVRRGQICLCVVGGKARGKEATKHWWMDNNNMDLGEIDWGGMDLIGLAQDRDKWKALVNAVVNLRV